VQAQSQPEVYEYSRRVGLLKAGPEIESGETNLGIKFKGLNSWVTEVLQSVLNSK
jgi:hypothetical protein